MFSSFRYFMGIPGMRTTVRCTKRASERFRMEIQGRALTLHQSYRADEICGYVSFVWNIAPC